MKPKKSPQQKQPKARHARREQQDIIEKLAAGWRPVYLLVAIVLLVYFRVIFFDLVGLDDAQLIGQPESQIHSLAGALSSFTASTYVDFYRPGLIFSFYLMRLLGGNALPFYHLCGVLLHAAACCLAWLLLLRLGVSRVPALLLSAVMAVHPLLTQAVAWIMGSNDTLLTVLILISFLFFLRVGQSGKTDFALFSTLHLAFFAAALLVKETAIALPAFCTVYWFLNKERRPALRGCLCTALGWVLIAAAWFALRSEALARVPSQQLRFSSEANVGNFAQNLRVLPEMFGQLFLPIQLSAYPTFQTIALVSGFLAAALCVLLIWLTPGKNWAALLLGPAWFALFLTPTLFFRQQYAESGYDYLNHRIYLSMFGILLVAAELHRAWAARSGRSFVRAFNRAAPFLIAAMALATLGYVGTFQDRLAFWENAARTSPQSSRAHGTYAQALLRYRRDLQQSESHLRTAVELESAGPRHLSFMNNLAGVYSQLGKQNEAVALWKQILTTEQVFPGEEDVQTQAMANLMLFYFQEKKMSEAGNYYEDLKRRGIDVDRQFPEAAAMMKSLKQ